MIEHFVLYSRWLRFFQNSTLKQTTHFFKRLHKGNYIFNIFNDAHTAYKTKFRSCLPSPPWSGPHLSPFYVLCDIAKQKKNTWNNNNLVSCILNTHVIERKLTAQMVVKDPKLRLKIMCCLYLVKSGGLWMTEQRDPPQLWGIRPPNQTALFIKRVSCSSCLFPRGRFKFPASPWESSAMWIIFSCGTMEHSTSLITKACLSQLLVVYC